VIDHRIATATDAKRLACLAPSREATPHRAVADLTPASEGWQRNVQSLPVADIQIKGGPDDAERIPGVRP